MRSVALGLLQVPIHQLPEWTLADFDGAWEVYRNIHINEPWRRARSQSFYQLVSQGSNLKNWEDVYQLADDVKKYNNKAVFREPTAEEKELLINLQNGQR